MESESLTLPDLLMLGAVVGLFGSVAGLAFAGWVRFGDAIVLALSEQGLSFCF